MFGANQRAVCLQGDGPFTPAALLLTAAFGAARASDPRIQFALVPKQGLLPEGI